MLVRQGVIRSRAGDDIVEGSQVEEQELSNPSPKPRQHLIQEMKEHTEEPWKYLGSQESWPPFTTYIGPETSAYLKDTGLDEAAQEAMGYRVMNASITGISSLLPLDCTSVTAMPLAVGTDECSSEIVVRPTPSSTGSPSSSAITTAASLTSTEQSWHKDIKPEKERDVGHSNQVELQAQCPCPQLRSFQLSSSSDRFKCPPKRNPNLVRLRDTKTFASTPPITSGSTNIIKPKTPTPMTGTQASSCTESQAVHTTTQLEQAQKSPSKDRVSLVSLKANVESPQQHTPSPSNVLELVVGQGGPVVSPSRMTPQEALHEAYRSSQRAVDLEILPISGDGLDSVTQDVQAFHLVNAMWHWDDDDLGPWRVYLLDTPGFSDSKMSEMEIFNKIEQWLKHHDLMIYHVLYFCRITDTRLAGTGKRIIQLIRGLYMGDEGFTIVTTMWDTIHTKAALERAENHFKELQDDICQQIEDGAKICKFYNTHASALDVQARSKDNIPLLYQELLDRIQNTLWEKRALQEDRAQLITRPNAALQAVVIPKLQELDQLIAKYIHQLVDFGSPPPGFCVVPQHVSYEYHLECLVDTDAYLQAVTRALSLLQSDDNEGRTVFETALQNFEDDITRAADQFFDLGFPLSTMVLPSFSTLGPPSDMHGVIPLREGSHTPYTVQQSPSTKRRAFLEFVRQGFRKFIYSFAKRS
ncbi:hypothetical protein CVT24_010020 [Panaeolus cyanescens]|uniref:G domain-containing protein n=1 Tax=Panaeolus cyanescens TaxID=181874 RepID=A0A409W3S3_9AGAR|nr:hypothetical protein CVT24_010020 [Panaeolus cyanescens]